VAALVVELESGNAEKFVHPQAVAAVVISEG